MFYDVKKAANSFLFTLHGKLTEAECKAFQEAIAPLIKGETENFYLDMRDLTLIDSVGMGMIMGIKMSCKRRGRRLVILSPSQEVQAAFSMVKFDQVLDIVSGKEAQAILGSEFQGNPMADQLKN